MNLFSQLSLVGSLVVVRSGTVHDAELDRFCQEVTGDPDSYCDSLQSSPNCYGTEIPCSMEDVVAYSTRETLSHTAVFDSSDPALVFDTVEEASSDPTKNKKWWPFNLFRTSKQPATPSVPEPPTGPVDPCSFKDAVLLGRPVTSGGSYFMPLQSLSACMRSTKISRANIVWTLHNLLYGLAETYSFTDIARDSLGSVESNVCNFKVHEVRVDLENDIRRELAQVNSLFDGKSKEEIDVLLSEELPAYDFHKSLVILLNRLHDAHTAYSTPFTMYRVYAPVTFGSRLSADGSGQEIILRVNFSQEAPLGKLVSAYRKVFGGAFPIGPERSFAVVSEINGMPALEFLKFLTSETGLLAASYQQQEQRMNAFIFNSPVLAFSQTLSYLPDFSFLDIKFASDNSVIRVNLLGQFTDLSLSPYQVVPRLDSTAALSAHLHSNPAFDAFILQEADLDKKRSTLWQGVVDAAVDDMNPGGLMSSVSPVFSESRLRRLSKKHRALLDPVNNMIRDNILNIPMHPDDPTIINLHEAPENQFLSASILAERIDSTLRRATGGNEMTTLKNLEYQFVGDATVVVRIPSFSPDAESSTDSEFYFFPEFAQIQTIAKSKGVTRLLIDVSGNGGGFVVSAYAMMWYTMSNDRDICAPMRKRITENWALWMESFGGGVDSILEKYLKPAGVDFVINRIDSIFKEIAAIITVVYDGLSQAPEELGSVDKLTALDRVSRKKMAVQRLPSKSAKFLAIIEYIKSGQYIPLGVDLKKVFYGPHAGFPPFDPKELTQVGGNGALFDPPLSNYRNREDRNWGGKTINLSLPGEYEFCHDVVKNMPSVARGYDRNWWTQIAFVSDGTCGSACALFVQGIQASGDAVGFTYGGVKDNPLDVASFAGGNVEEYVKFTGELSLARRIARLASQGLDEWSTAHADSFVDSPVPMSTKSTVRFNWNMMFMKAMETDSTHLPRQFYLVPGRKHLNTWPTSQRAMSAVYRTIADDPDWATVVPQFAVSHGICPEEATPFAKRNAQRSITTLAPV
jgi:hypothetical protein